MSQLLLKIVGSNRIYRQFHNALRVTKNCHSYAARNAENKKRTPTFADVRPIGVAGFEPVASTSRTWHSTKLSYTPMLNILL